MRNVLSLLTAIVLLHQIEDSIGLSLRDGHLNCATSSPAHSSADRRSFVQAMLMATSSVIIPTGVFALEPAPRFVDVGGGFDLRSGNILKTSDALFPASMEGIWDCERVVLSSEGDSFQAESAWRALGGGKNKFKGVERYQVKYIQSDKVGDADGVVLDRGFEIQSRTGSSTVNWNVAQPNQLTYDGKKLVAVQRTVELPSDKGFGSAELFLIEEGPFERAAQVKRRFRRGFDESGNRVVEGLEILKTYRVLDGVAGTEMPTSTTKSTIRLTR